jgi:hypothetical protein
MRGAGNMTFHVKLRGQMLQANPPRAIRDADLIEDPRDHTNVPVKLQTLVLSPTSLERSRGVFHVKRRGYARFRGDEACTRSA